jgi:FlaA1/EpsC-like NDP-sugar epimerase/ActR/RegA family two-component response regulator
MAKGTQLIEQVFRNATKSRIANCVLRHRFPIVLGTHLALFAMSFAGAFLLRFEFRPNAQWWKLMIYTLPALLAVRVLAFAYWRLFSGWWQYVSVKDLTSIVKATTLSSAIFVFIVVLIHGHGFPRSVILIDAVLCVMFVGGSRFAMRVLREAVHPMTRGEKTNILIVGAGDFGEVLVKEMLRKPEMGYSPKGFIDDDPHKLNARIHDIPVLGGVEELGKQAARLGVSEVIIAIPSATGSQIRRIVDSCREAKVRFKTVPSMGELMQNSFSLSKVRRVEISDILRREPVEIDHTGISEFVRGKRILVTGAGGSIGSELCRQIAGFGPQTLVMLERAENNLFFTEMELKEKFPQVSLRGVIGDVTDEDRVSEVFQEQQPQIVFHAAAHKHVPLMERNRVEAVKNNVLGTMVVANVAERFGVQDFVMISTDKAVRPTSVMGATKRLAEMYVQSLNAHSQTKFMTVRFGNVLGSEGSVLQVFQRQIEAGGPITITHPDMMRYFMTIPEASQLVLQAASQGNGGEIFVLDMGDPVSIVDLAKDLLALSGLDPEKDIEIRYTGPRPGEKLFEELLNSETRILPTSHEKIMVVETDPVEFEDLQVGIFELLGYAGRREEELLLAKMEALVPGYVSGQELVLAPRVRDKRILVVENEPYTRTTLKRILQARYQVFEAENDRQALLRVKECEPNLVILDFHLPSVNIRQLCKKIKLQKGGESLPIILLANSADTTSLNQVLAMGADDRLYKPIPVNILETRVNSLLEREKTRRQPVPHSPLRGEKA